MNIVVISVNESVNKVLVGSFIMTIIMCITR